MKRLLVPAVTVVSGLLVFVLMSCDGELPTAAEPGLSSSQPLAQAFPALHSVTGQGTSWYSGGWLVTALDVRAMPDGSVAGNFHWLYRSRDPGGRIFVKVSCMTIIDNEAWLMGQASQAGNPDNVGKWMGIWVADNGEGQADVPDQILHRWLGPSDAGGGPPPAALAFCPGADSGTPTPRDIVSGDIQVH